MNTTIPYQAPPLHTFGLRILAVSSAAMVAAAIQFLFAGLIGTLAARLSSPYAAAAGAGTFWSPVIVLLISFPVAILHVMHLRGVFECRKRHLNFALAEAALVTLGSLAAAVVSAFYLESLEPGVLPFVAYYTPLFLTFLIGLKGIVFSTCLLSQPARPESSAPSPHATAFLWYAQDAVVFSAGLGWLLTLLLFTIPKFYELFRDFRTNLPALTEQILALYRVTEDYPALALLSLLVASFLLVLPMLIYRLTRPSVQTQRSYIPVFALSLIVSLVAGLPVLIGLYLPFAKLIQSIQGGESGDNGGR